MSMVNQTAHNVKSSANGLEGTDMDSTDATWWTELRAEFPYLENHVRLIRRPGADRHERPGG